MVSCICCLFKKKIIIILLLSYVLIIHLGVLPEKDLIIYFLGTSLDAVSFFANYYIVNYSLIVFLAIKTEILDLHSSINLRVSMYQ